MQGKDKLERTTKVKSKIRRVVRFNRSEGDIVPRKISPHKQLQGWYMHAFSDSKHSLVAYDKRNEGVGLGQSRPLLAKSKVAC